MVRAGAGGFIVTTGTLVVYYPLSRRFSELFNEELVFSSLARCLTYCECAVLWLIGACCLDLCGPLLHTTEDVLLPMVFINGLRVCGPVQTPATSLHRSSTGRRRGQHRQRCIYVLPTKRGKIELIMHLNSMAHVEQ